MMDRTEFLYGILGSPEELGDALVPTVTPDQLENFPLARGQKSEQLDWWAP